MLAGSGVWLLLRPRTFQVIIGLSLLSYAVNLFIFAMGRLRTGAPPVLAARGAGDPRALRRSAAAGAGADRDRHQLRDDGAVLVVLLASRGLTGTDHVDGREPERVSRMADHLIIAPDRAAARRRRRRCCS